MISDLEKSTQHLHLWFVRFDTRDLDSFGRFYPLDKAKTHEGFVATHRDNISSIEPVLQARLCRDRVVLNIRDIEYKGQLL